LSEDSSAGGLYEKEGQRDRETAETSEMGADFISVPLSLRSLRSSSSLSNAELAED